jgi:hypothetical protein
MIVVSFSLPSDPAFSFDYPNARLRLPRRVQGTVIEVSVPIIPID